MLWESGELDSAAAMAVKLHVEVCTSCQNAVNRFTAVYEEVAEVKAATASWKFREALRARKKRRVGKWRSSLRWITISTAASVVLTFAVSTFLHLTPAAQAEGLLKMASERETRTVARNFFKLTNGSLECFMVADAMGTRTVRTWNATTGVCDSASSLFLRAGWESGDLLSARNFRRWRDSLPNKSDTVTKRASTTAITTETGASPLRKATLELRTADYEPIAGQFEFVSSDSGRIQTFKLSKSEQSFDPETLPAVIPGPASGISQPKSAVKADPPSTDPVDRAEAQVRMALHRLGLDRYVLVAVAREGHVVKVWGLIAQSQKLSDLKEIVDGLPSVRLAMASDTDGPLPWEAYKGSVAPLAYDKIVALFPNNPQGRQEFVNALDFSTRRVVAAARSLEGILALATKIASTEYAPLLQQAASELQASIEVDLKSIAGRLQPLTDEPLEPSAEQMTARRASELYTLVHEVVFLARPDESPSLEEALTSIRSLLR